MIKIGKYKGRHVMEVIEGDKSYVEWICNGAWTGKMNDLKWDILKWKDRGTLGIDDWIKCRCCGFGFVAEFGGIVVCRDCFNFLDKYD